MVFIFFLPALIVVCSTLTLFAFQMESRKNENTLKLLDINDLDKWEMLFGGNIISNDGKWLVYSVRKNNRENELRLHNLTNDKVSFIKEASLYKFSEDNKWLGFIVSPDSKTQEKLREEKKTILRKFGLMNLETGETIYLNDVETYNFSGNGKFVAIKKAAAIAEAKTTNIIVRDLVSGKDRVFGNVKEFSWSENNSLLAVLTDLPDKIGNSVTLFDGNNQSIQLLDNQEAVYSSLTWRKNSEDLALLRSFKDKDFDEDNNEVLVWRNLSKSEGNLKIFKPATFANFPKDMKVPNKPNLQWSADGKSLFFGINKWKKKQEKKEEVKADETTKDGKPKLPEIPALEIWNASDVLTIPEQKLRTEADSHLSVWNIETNKFTKIADEKLEVSFQNDTPVLVAADKKPYDFEGMFGRPSSDIHTIDITTGTKQKILTNIPVLLYSAVSPGGKYFVYLKNDHLHLFDFATFKDINLTKELDDSFVNLEDDHPVSQKPPFGFIGWDKTGTYFIAHSKFDVWKFDAVTGKGTRLTNGKTENIQHRFERIPNPGESYLDLSQPYFIRHFGRLDKKSGYSLVTDGIVKKLFWGDANVSSVFKPKYGESFVFRIESYNDSPDLFVSQNAGSTPKQVSNINPFEKDLKSGKAEIINYTNAKGQKLQGSLYYPDDYDPNKKYPMITYIYELLSNGFHNYSLPSNTSYYNRRVFTSQGYFVFMPDIIFDAGDPGVSSVKTLEIAVKAVAQKGLIDEKRVGLVGHSWGGYQAAYAVTATNIFAAAVAGAGISNLLTMYGTLTPSFGNQFESKHFEVGQERMILPPWKNIEGYLRNSAIPNIQKMQTPLLMEVGDEDKNVNWGQGLEMYNAARREKKPMVLLVYAKEGHGLTQPKNQIDYQKRILDWFGHYLKNEPAKKWIKENVPYTEQQNLLKERQFD